MPEQNESASSMTNVLIIDDENQIRKFLDIALRAQGYKTLLAENGQKGLELYFARRRFSDPRFGFARFGWL